MRRERKEKEKEREIERNMCFVCAKERGLRVLWGVLNQELVDQRCE
jgi:hypothetical protein